MKEQKLQEEVERKAQLAKEAERRIALAESSKQNREVLKQLISEDNRHKK